MMLVKRTMLDSEISAWILHHS